MKWIAPPEKDTGTETLEDRLWAAADQLRANSGLTSAQYSQPVLGLIFLRFAEVRFLAKRTQLEKQASSGRRGSRVDDPAAYHADHNIIYLTPKARFDHLLRLPEGADVGKAVNDAMRNIESENPQLAGVLPKTYQLFESTLLKNLLKKVSETGASSRLRQSRRSPRGNGPTRLTTCRLACGARPQRHLRVEGQMTKVLLSVLLLVVAPLPAVDVSGVWNLDMQWSGSDSHSTGVCTIKQDGQKLTGSCASAKSTLTGDVLDRSLTLQIDVEQDGNKGQMTFTGTVDEDVTVIKGSCQIVGGQEGTFVMKKQRVELI